jgi:hypothetical protein
MDTANEQIELSLTNDQQPISISPAEPVMGGKWQQRYLLEQLDQIWLLPVWFWPDFWSAPSDGQPFTGRKIWEQDELPEPVEASLGQTEIGSANEQWLSVKISAAGALPLVEIQGPGMLSVPNGNTERPHPVTTTIFTADGILRLDGTSLRLPSGLPGVLRISHQPAIAGNPRWRINLALHHPAHGPFFEFQGVFCLPEQRKSGLVDQLQISNPIRHVLELL